MVCFGKNWIGGIFVKGDICLSKWLVRRGELLRACVRRERCAWLHVHVRVLIWCWWANVWDRQPALLFTRR